MGVPTDPVGGGGTRVEPPIGPIPEAGAGMNEAFGESGLTGVRGDPVTLPVVWRQPAATKINPIDETARRHERIVFNPIAGGRKLICVEL